MDSSGWIAGRRGVEQERGGGSGCSPGYLLFGEGPTVTVNSIPGLLELGVFFVFFFVFLRGLFK